MTKSQQKETEKQMREKIAKLEAENRQLNSLLDNAFQALEAQERVIKGLTKGIQNDDS